MLSLDALITLSIRLDDFTRDRVNLTTTKGRKNESSYHSGVEPMQLGKTRLIRTEKERRRTQRLCFYCGNNNIHFPTALNLLIIRRREPGRGKQITIYPKL